MRTLAILVLLVSPARVLAEPTPDDVAKADKLFTEARVLVDAGKASEACPKFEQSQALDPGRGTLINLAACYEATARAALALQLYRDVERQSVAAGDAVRVKASRERIAAIERIVGRVQITFAGTPPSGVTVEVNAQAVPDAQWADVAIDPGVVKIRASAPGRRPHETTINAARGVVTAVQLPALEIIPATAPADRGVAPADDPPTRRQRGRVVIAAGIAGVGVIALAASVYLALDAKRDYRDAIENECGGDHLDCTPAGFDHANAARTRGNVATVLGGVGFAAAATAAVVWWTAPREPHRPAVGALVSPDAIGITVAGAF